MANEHVGYVVQIKELQKHPNADRLQIAVIFGASVIVDLSVKIGDLGVYFPIDLQLSEEFCKENDLVRRKDENGNPAGGYLDPNKRNIRAMRFRGSKSEGLYLPIEVLKYTGVTQFSVGDKIGILNDHEICRKYIPQTNPRPLRHPNGNRSRKKKVPISPLFSEHADTEQLAYNLDAFKANDLIEITLKMHGTSQRTGYLPRLAKFKKNLFDYIFRRDGKPVYKYGYVTGTRRTVLEDFEARGFYESNDFRRLTAKAFENKLHKGETVYYEVLGFDDFGRPIMPSCNNKKISDKEFLKQYGDTTTFSYGCDPHGDEAAIYPYYWEGDPSHNLEGGPVIPTTTLYVYRMTMTNEDGDVVEYSPDFMRYRCEQIGVKCVPVLWQGYIPPCEKTVLYENTENGLTTMAVSGVDPGEWIKDIAEQYYDGPDPIGESHVREGVVVRIVNRPNFCAFKHKNFSFKVLEGIAKDLAAEPDMEEAQELEVEE